MLGGCAVSVYPGGTTVYTFVLDARVLLASVSKVRHWDLGTVSVKCQHRLGH